jgi:D-alanyl-D-alanine carboxypeptidase
MNTVKSILRLLMPVCLLLATNYSYASHAEIIIDAATGSVLHEENATHSWYPASLTKVMTLYMTFDALKAGEINLNDILTTSQHAARQPNSKLGLRQGEKLTVQEAILAVITRSANDAAVVLSEHLGGTEENFAIKMTTKGHSLGMYDSHFMNATGLPHPWQVTTSRDMALLAWKTQQNFPNYYPYFSTHNFNFKGRELRGINKFTATYPGAEGMKTGFTCGSGYNLISVANQNGKRLIGVILGGMTSPERYQLMIKMMNNGFANRADANQNTNINSMASSNGAAPPFQLGCGNMPQTNTSLNSANNTYIPKVKVKLKNKHHHSIHHPTITPTLKKTAIIRPIAKAKLKVVTKNKSKATKIEKANKTRYHHLK